MANPANFARHNQAFNSDSLQRGICFANFTPRCKPLRRQAGSVLPVNLALACENVITESFVLLVQELVSSIAFKIAVRLKVGQHERWKRMVLEFFVFALLVIPLFFIFGWLFLQAVSWLL